MTRTIKKTQRPTGDVFQDLGFSSEESKNLAMRSELMIRLSRVIEERGLTQTQAAGLFGVSQPRVSDLVTGKIDRFSVDTLIAMLGHAGVQVQLRILAEAGGSGRARNRTDCCRV